MCCLFNCTLLFSQTTYNQCGTDEIHHYLMTHDTTYANKINSVERNLQLYQNNNDNLRLMSDTVLTIPVVVHIIHTNNANGLIDNPTDQQVIDMIAELNKTFSATSTNYPNVSSGGVNTKIQFVFAKRTPNCTATNGIVREYAGDVSRYVDGGVQSSFIFDNSRCGISSTQMQSISPLWPINNYFNLYLVRDICNRGAFAYLGEYVVCTTTGFALPHETGHYFYLYHTFTGQDGASCPVNIDCAQQGDAVCDTDPHLQNGGAPTDINTCTGRVFGNVVKNFMSYNQNLLFTNGQKARMRTILESGNFPVANSQGTLSPAPIAQSCSIAQISGTIPLCSDSYGQFKVTFSSNTGANPTIQWYLNNSIFNYGEIISVYGSQINNNDILTCKVTSTNFCALPNPAVSNQITLKKTISVLPTIAISTTDVFLNNYICQDSLVKFKATITNGGTNPIYQWKINNVNVGINSPTYSSNTLATDNITCTLTSNEKCVTANNITSNGIYVRRYTQYNPNVTIAIMNGYNPLICEGSSLVFRATGTGYASTPDYQWKINNLNVGLNSAEYTASTLRNNDIINCLFTSKDRCVSNNKILSNSIQVKVKTKVTPTLSIQNLTNNDSTCVGEIVKLKAIPANTGTPTFLWYSTYNSTKDTITDIITAYSKTYYCSVRIDTANYCSNSPTVTATRKIYGEIKPLKPTISLVTNYLKSNSATGNQWYSVATGKIIGAVNQTFYPVSNGKYYTVVTKNRCSSLHSDTITINNITTGIDDNWNDDESKIKIIPNPNSGSFKIELNEKINENVSVLIYNILGEQLYSKTFKRIYDNEINIQSDIISNGLYNVVIRTKENLYSKKIEIIK